MLFWIKFDNQNGHYEQSQYPKFNNIACTVAETWLLNCPKNKSSDRKEDDHVCETVVSWSLIPPCYPPTPFSATCTSYSSLGRAYKVYLCADRPVRSVTRFWCMFPWKLSLQFFVARAAQYQPTSLSWEKSKKTCNIIMRLTLRLGHAVHALLDIRSGIKHNSEWSKR